MQAAERTAQECAGVSRAETLAAAAQTQEADGRRAVARQLYAKCLALQEDTSPHTLSLILTLARLHGEDGQHKQAINYYLKALDRFPDEPDQDMPRAAVTQALGRQMLRDGQCESAQRFIELGMAENAAQNKMFRSFRMSSY